MPHRALAHRPRVHEKLEDLGGIIIDTVNQRRFAKAMTVRVFSWIESSPLTCCQSPPPKVDADRSKKERRERFNQLILAAEKLGEVKDVRFQRSSSYSI